MKRFMIFAYDAYYPSGGMDDFVADFDTLEDASLHVQTIGQSFGLYVKIYDSNQRKYVLPKED